MDLGLDYSCSSFVVGTNSGGRILARNLDADFAPILVLKTYSENGYTSISVVNLGVLGFSESYVPDDLVGKIYLLAAPYLPVDGMNERGLAINVNTVNGGDFVNQETDKVDLMTTTLIRLVLDKARNVDEALELIRGYDLHDSVGGPYHFQIADKTGRSVIVEYYDNEMRVFGDDRGFQVMTNHLVGGDLIDEDFLDSYSRYDMIEKELTGKSGVMSTSEAFDLLTDEDVQIGWGPTEQDVLGYLEFIGEYDVKEVGDVLIYSRGLIESLFLAPKGGTLYSTFYDLGDLKLNLVFKGDMERIYEFGL